MKIAICVPHTGTINAKTAHCLGDLLVATAQADIIYNGSRARPEIVQIFGRTGPLDYKRTNLALAALENGSDYLLWLDSDQTFTPDALVRLMIHDKPIVGGNYPDRIEESPTAYEGQNRPLPRRTGLEQVAAVGFGFVLMKTAILRQVPHPWFAHEVAPNGELRCSEDFHFCNQARSVGIPVFVDHDLVIGHVAERVLTLEDRRADAGPIRPSPGDQ